MGNLDLITIYTGVIKVKSIEFFYRIMDRNKFDVVIVGGGVIGLFCAYYLNLQGKSVLVLEKGEIMKSCSYGNCGLISPSHAFPLNSPQLLLKAAKWVFQKDSPFYVRPQWDKEFLSWMFDFAKISLTKNQRVKSMHGRHGLLTSSRDLYGELLADSNWNCNWSPSGIHFVFHKRKCFEEYAKKDDILKILGVAAQPLISSELHDMEPSLTEYAYGSWYYPMDASLNPGELLMELSTKLRERGVQIIENSPVEGWLESNGGLFGVQLADSEYLADNVVLATGSVSPKMVENLKLTLPVIPGKGYSITMKSPNVQPKCPIIFDEHKVVATPWKDSYRLGGTMEFSGHDSSFNPHRIENLKTVASKYLKEPYSQEHVSNWFGWRPMTPDGLPIIDRSPRHSNLFLACGHNMLGLSMAPATGKMISELIDGQVCHIDPQPYSLN